MFTNPFMLIKMFFEPVLDVFRYASHRPHVAVRTKTTGRLVRPSPFGVHRRKYNTGIETLEQFMARVSS